MNETAHPALWPESMLRAYADMLTVDEISRILSIEPRKARELLTHPDASIRLPEWRSARAGVSPAMNCAATWSLTTTTTPAFSAGNDERGTL